MLLVSGEGLLHACISSNSKIQHVSLLQTAFNIYSTSLVSEYEACKSENISCNCAIAFSISFLDLSIFNTRDGSITRDMFICLKIFLRILQKIVPTKLVEAMPCVM